MVLCETKKNNLNTSSFQILDFLLDGERNLVACLRPSDNTYSILLEPHIAVHQAVMESKTKCSFVLLPWLVISDKRPVKDCDWTN